MIIQKTNLSFFWRYDPESDVPKPHFLMPTHQDDIQDDYYANLNSQNTSADSGKKTIKIKKKIITPPKHEEEGVTKDEIKKPKIISRKKETPASIPENK